MKTNRTDQRMEENVEFSWDAPIVLDYDQNIQRKIAGYELLHEITGRLMESAIDTSRSTSELLIIGAGGGKELVSLAQNHPFWRFTAVDSSKLMLDMAKRRAGEAHIMERVRFFQGTLDQCSDGTRYDAATCLLVLHFVQGMNEKRQLLREIASRLQSGAPFFLASLNGEPDQAVFEVQLTAWKSHMLSQGVSEEEFAKFKNSIGQSTEPISSEKVYSLLEECGFTDISRYFGSYLIDGFMAFKK